MHGPELPPGHCAVHDKGLVAVQHGVRVDVRKVEEVAHGRARPLEGDRAVTRLDPVARAGDRVGHVVEVEHVVAEPADEVVGQQAAIRG